MDAISYSYADKQAKRIKKFIENPDSNSGIVTVPKVIGAGENITIPAGRIAVLPNVQVDGTLNVEAGGEVFIPAGATLSKVVETTGNQTIEGVKTFSSSPVVPTPTTGTQVTNKTYVDTKQSKSELAYNINTSSFIPNTLSSGAVIERGSNANGEYVKFADGTLICKNILNGSEQAIQGPYGGIFVGTRSWIYPYAFVDVPYRSLNIMYVNQAPWCEPSASTNTIAYFYIYDVAARGSGIYMDFSYLAIGRWK